MTSRPQAFWFIPLYRIVLRHQCLTIFDPGCRVLKANFHCTVTTATYYVSAKCHLHGNCCAINCDQPYQWSSPSLKGGQSEVDLTLQGHSVSVAHTRVLALGLWYGQWGRHLALANLTGNLKHVCSIDFHFILRRHEGTERMWCVPHNGERLLTLQPPSFSLIPHVTSQIQHV